MFKRAHHQRIAQLLQAFNTQLLLQAECYFGGGTAIVLQLDEYRESVDVDFLCSSVEGYRTLRSLVARDLGPLLRVPVAHLREVTSNQNKIFTFLSVDEVRIKVEFVREGNTRLAGQFDTDLGVPTLSRVDLWAQKLMANADRALDKSTLSRDIIDIAMMIRGWGNLPREAYDKAFEAYGTALARGFHNANFVIADRAYLKRCMHEMDMDLSLADEIVRLLDDAAADLPLDALEQSERQRRIAALRNLEQAAGASFIFGRVALHALDQTPAGERVNWAQVEREAVLEGLATPGCDPHEMINAIIEHSPVATSAARIRSVSARIEAEWQSATADSVGSIHRSIRL